MNNKTHRIIEAVAASVDIPESAYEKAEARYKDLAAWFGRPESACGAFDPHIYPQGSFRLGTVVQGDEYDLDFGCRLRKGISKSTHTQKQLKKLVGDDMAAYRQARHIESVIQEKPRCWRLQYQEESGFKFHMDGVPSIPTDVPQYQLIIDAMVKHGLDAGLAQAVANYAGNITDNRLLNYELISPDWRISNSEGFALWFEARMKQAMALLEKRVAQAKLARVDELPARKWKTPLQQCVQLLKCHRDIMFVDDPDGKPISVILTTLAAEAYQGEEDVGIAVENILANMGKFVRSTRPRVPNPVNPAEDFADKWNDRKYHNLKLEDKFWGWLKQAQNDLAIISQSQDANHIVKQVKDKFGGSLSISTLRDILGVQAANNNTPHKRHNITQVTTKPWMR